MRSALGGSHRIRARFRGAEEHIIEGPATFHGQNAASMKRFRIFGFDRRALTLVEEQEHWDEVAKESHRDNRQQTLSALVSEIGEARSNYKLANFVDLRPKPLSIFAFHNRFLGQIRTSFVMAAYYPALTAACALGERILNHLVLLLREDFRATPEYKRVHRKASFDNWEVPIGALEAWGVLLPKASESFRALEAVRHRSIHFDPATDHDDRPLALQALNH